MTNDTRAQQVIEESRPMLTEFLEDVGLHQSGAPLDLKQALEPVSNWVDAQQVEDEDRVYLAARLAAFISEYLIDVHAADRQIVDGKVLLRLKVADGVLREFDPYKTAAGMVMNRTSLKDFLDKLCA